MNRVAFSAFGGEGDELVEVFSRGSATSMGPNGWNPNPTLKGLCPVDLCGLGCSHVEHREVCHPMCGGSWNFTCAGYVRSFDS
jgi:hypothetical protein